MAGLVALGAGLGLAIAMIILILRLTARLRDRHPEAYRAIGSPDFFRISARPDRPLFRYLYSPDRVDLGDRTATGMLRALQIGLPTLGIFFAINMAILALLVR